MGLLEGKNAIVTGANRGIGNAIVHEFAKLKCNVWACARLRSETFEAEIQMLSEKEGIWIEPVYFDVTDSEAMESAIKAIHAQKKRVDILVNVAGISHLGLFQMSRIEDLRRVFDVNFFAVVALTQLVLRMMVKNRSGSIVNLSSIMGVHPSEITSFYCCSKAAVSMFTKTLALEVAPFGIRVNAVAPGNTNTDMLMPIMKNYNKGHEAMLNLTAMNRLARPEEIAAAVAFLASDKASFINGEILYVDGGLK